MNTLISWSLTQIKRMFALDLRSLALFRIGAAVLLLCDLWTRAHDLRAHYTDEGILPRKLIDLFNVDAHYAFSIHTWTGQVYSEAVLFVLAAVFAVCLAAGFKTRSMTLLSWFLLCSLHARNDTILDNSDTYLRVMMFWAVFLPLSERWSIDAAIRKDRGLPQRIATKVPYTSLATAGLLLQIAWVYTTAGFSKSGAAWSEGGSALYNTLMFDPYTSALGVWLRQFPALLQALTPWVVNLERFGSWLFIVPLLTGPLRMAAEVSFVAFHLGTGLSLNLGLAVPVYCLGLVAILPQWAWTAAAGVSRKVLPQSWQAAYSRRLDELETAWASKVHLWTQDLPAEIVEPEIGSRAWGMLPASLNSKAVRSGLVAAVWLTVIVLTALLNLSSLPNFQGKFPEAMRPLFVGLRLDQKWNFSDAVADRSVWFVAAGRTRDGTQVDLLSGSSGEVDLAKPSLVSSQFPDSRWRNYLLNLWSDDRHVLVSSYGDHLCNAWNNAGDTDAPKLQAFAVLVFEQAILPDQKFSLETKKIIFKNTCAQDTN